MGEVFWGGVGGGFWEVLERFWGGFWEVWGRVSGIRKTIKNFRKRIETYKPYKKDFPFLGLRKSRWGFITSIEGSA